jgi:hypothetical protein
MIICAAAVAAICAAPSATFAAVIFQDDFNKSNQPLLGTTPNISGGNWTITGTSVVNPIQISGNQVPLTTTGQDAFAPFLYSATNAAGFPIRTSADINLSAVGTGDYFLHVSDPAGTTTFFFQRLGAVATTGGYFLTLAATSGGGATTTPGTTVLALGTTYHVDVDWNFVAGATNDTFQVWVNGSSYLTKTWDSTNAEPTSVSAVNFRQGTTGSAATLTVDNLTVEQVPEPSSLTLLALAAMFGVAKRRRS